MWFVKVSTMAEPNRRFNKQVEAVHREMQAKAAAA
jgi:hypothetical protein